MILLGYASAMRRAELVALTLADIEHKPAVVLLHIRRSKTDQDGNGQVVAVAHGQHANTDPVAALNSWRPCAVRRPDRRTDPAQGPTVLVNRYIRPMAALTTTSSKDFGP